MLYHFCYLLDFEEQRYRRGEIRQSSVWTAYFRRVMPNLRQVVESSLRTFPLIDPSAKWNANDHVWKFGCGMHFLFGAMEKEHDYLKYYSWEFAEQNFDELTEFCVHPDTDVLTEGGWKRIADVAVGDRVMSLSPARDIEWRDVTKTYAFDYDGPLLETKNKTIRFSITPAHRMVTVPQGKRSREWRFQRARELDVNARFPFAGQWRGEELDWIEMPTPPSRNGGGAKGINWAPRVLADDFLEFLGWWFSEGSAYLAPQKSGSTAYLVSVSQTKPAPDLASLIQRLPWRSRTEGRTTGWVIASKQLYGYLSPLGNTYTKRVPAWLKNLCPRQLKIFFDAFARGDGHQVKKSPSCGISFGLANDGLIDDLQEIATKLGRRSYKFHVTQTVKGKKYPAHCLYVHGYETSHVTDKSANRSWRPYKGPVHCITVEKNHTFLARYQGRLFWSGNSEEQWDQLGTRVRSPDPALRPFLNRRWGSNPTGAGLIWVRRRFVDVYKDLGVPVGTTVRVKTPLAGGRDFFHDQVFIQAHLSDNPSLSSDGQYEATLRRTKPHIYKALLEGNWYYTSGGLFSHYWREDHHVCDNHKVPPNTFHFRSGDWGLNSHSSITWWYVDADGQMTAYYNLYVKEMTPAMVAQAIKEIEVYFGDWDDENNRSMLKRSPLDAKCFHREGSGNPNVADEFRKQGVQWIPSIKDRFNGLAEVARRLDYFIDLDTGKRINVEQIVGRKVKPMIRWMRRCEAPRRIIPVIPRDPNNPGDVARGSEDHCVDDLMYACSANPLKAKLSVVRDDDVYDDEQDYSARFNRKGGLARLNGLR
jgi:hypothetical protein